MTEAAAAIPPAESVVLNAMEHAHNKGHAALMNIAIARDCPSLRSHYLALAAVQLERAVNELEGARAAQELRALAGEEDSDAGVPAATIIYSATNEAGKIIETRSTPPGPSIRCNGCHDPDNCPQCRALNAERDARFGEPKTFESATR